MTPRNRDRVFLIGGATAAAWMAAGLVMLMSQPAQATQVFADQTGKACSACHKSAAGGGKLTPYGKKFHANGDKVPDAAK